MPNKAKIILLTTSLLVVSLGLTACGQQTKASPAGSQAKLPTRVITFMNADNDNITLTAELASTATQRQIGLMGRTSLGADEGMLFVLPTPMVTTFWMKNTLIPLDMIWVDENGKIIDIQQAEPCLTATCPSYTPPGPVKFVLETNQGWAQSHSIDSSATIYWPSV